MLQISETSSTKNSSGKFSKTVKVVKAKPELSVNALNSGVYGVELGQMLFETQIRQPEKKLVFGQNIFFKCQKLFTTLKKLF